jgi:predicted YcjX-like family ATPase
LIGLQNSGKTVFLVSLINHLEHHRPTEFKVDNDGRVQISNLVVDPPQKDWKRFKYSEARQCIAEDRVWPSKTVDRSQVILSYERSDWWLNKGRLIIYDIAGERFADAPMFGRDYDSWSHHMWLKLEDLVSGAESRAPGKARPRLFQSFIEAVEAGTVTAEELVRSYRIGLANMLHEYRAYISPSTFFLDQKGDMVRDRMDDGTPIPAAQIAAERYTGLSAERQFVPLPPECRSLWKDDVVQLFTENYTAYQEEVVDPVFGALKSCHSLVVLVDVLTVLQNGIGMYTDSYGLMKELFRGIKPGDGVVRAPIRWFASALPTVMRPGWVRKIAFVVPKMDLVAPEDREALLTLAKDLMHDVAKDLQRTRYEYMLCSAIYSAKDYVVKPDTAFVFFEVDPGHSVAPAPGGSQDNPLARIPIPRLPNGWHRHLQPGQFVFPEIPPPVSRFQNKPPHHENLDRVFKFLTE